MHAWIHRKIHIYNLYIIVTFPLGVKKQQNLSSYTFPYEEKLLEVLQKAYEKVFHQLYLADLSSIYSLTIFLKHIFNHITSLLRNHRSCSWPEKWTQKPHSNSPVPVTVCSFLLQVSCTVFLSSTSSLNKTGNLLFLNKPRISSP